MKSNYKITFVSVLSAVLAVMSLPTQVNAQGLGPVPTDLGSFSLGAGVYQAPDDAISDSGLYGLARYEISSFEFEIDYGLSDQNFFLGAADYLYYFPTASGVTQTKVALGAGVTFVNNDPTMDGSETGFNLLGQIRFMDSLAAQVRHDFLGDNASLWTFGLSWTFY